MAIMALLERAKQSQQVLAHAQAFLDAEPDDHLDLLNASRMPVQLRKYWLTHEAWTAHGAFDACVRDLREHGVPGHMVEGACANLHKEATGRWPGEGHKGHVSAPFFARVAQSRLRLAKYDPSQKRDDEGKWTDGGLDKLKLGSRIQLGDGERLLSSRKFKTARDDGSMDLLAAEVDTPSGREVRLGIIDPDDSKRWSAGPDPKRAARLAEIEAEQAGVAEWDPRFEELEEERIELYSEGDVAGRNRSATLTPAALAQLHTELDAAAVKAQEWSKAWRKFWQDHARESDEQAALADIERRGGTLTPEQSARLAELTAITDQSPEWEPTFAEGLVPAGGDGDLVYKVQGFDGDEGEWRVDLGIRPDGGDEAWYPGAEDDAAKFEPKDVKVLLAGLAELAQGSTAAPANQMAVRVVAEFTESKHKRDRKGRFATKAAAAEVIGEMDALMAKLSELMKSSGVDDDERSDLDLAMDYMKMARRSRETRGDDKHDGYASLDTVQYHNLEIQADTNDGTVSIEHDEGSFFVSAAEAEEIAGFIDEFDDITIPDGTKGTDVVAERTTSSGDYQAVLWSSGLIEIGETNYINESENNLLIDPSGADDARNIADALEEAAHAAVGGPVTNLTVSRLFNHPGHPDQGVHNPHKHGRRKLPGVPDVARPDKPSPKKRATKKAAPRKAAPSKPATEAKPGVDYHAEPWKAPTAERELASAFHEQWRESRRNEDGSFEPRVKTTKDKAWAAQHGTDQVDIANTDYKDLPDDWQAENKAAAQTVIELLEHSQGTPLDNDDKRSEAGEFIHDAWLARNEWAKGGELDVPFDELPKVEQDKDIAQYETALKVFHKSRNAKVDRRSMSNEAVESSERGRR